MVFGLTDFALAYESASGVRRVRFGCRDLKASNHLRPAVQFWKGCLMPLSSAIWKAKRITSWRDKPNPISAMSTKYCASLSSIDDSTGAGPGLLPIVTIPFTLLWRVVTGTLYLRAESLRVVPLAQAVTAERIASSLQSLLLGVLA